jgi:hypothetical protein
MPSCGPTLMEAFNSALNVLTLLGLAYITAKWPPGTPSVMKRPHE